MEQKKGLIGIYEKANPNTVWEDHCPWESENELFAPDYDRLMPWLENALERMPIFAELGISRDVHGAISHPPDGNPLIGPVAGAPNYWCCCGTQIGIGWGPGLTRALAQWMVHGAAEISMRDYDPRRFGPYATKDWQVVKAKEDYCLRHEIPFPHFNRLAGRPVKTSPIYERLKAKGAVHEEVFGWERPRWFAPEGTPAQDIYSFKRSALDEIIAEEVRACREAAGIMDISSFSKIEVTGAGAAAFLDGLIPNKLPSVGRFALTHFLNRKGTIEAEITLIRLEDQRFYIVNAAFFEQRVMDHLTQRAPSDVTVRAVSQERGALALQGPLSREILAQCTQAALDNASFKWLTHQVIEIAGHPVDAIRMSYGGELGWELHMPMAAVLPIYDALKRAGAPLGLRDYGSFAMNAMRMEKGFKGAGELTNEVTLPEADVMRFVRPEKDFFGKEATLAPQPRWTCAYLQIEPDGVTDGHGGEAVLMEGKVVGSTSSVAYGPTVGKILAFAYIKPEAAAPGTELTVLIHGAARAAKVLAQPAYDPNSLLPRTDATQQAAE
jgi:dimethylglycine dehydrogenase